MTRLAGVFIVSCTALLAASGVASGGPYDYSPRPTYDGPNLDHLDNTMMIYRDLDLLRRRATGPAAAYPPPGGPAGYPGDYKKKRRVVTRKRVNCDTEYQRWPKHKIDLIRRYDWPRYRCWTRHRRPHKRPIIVRLPEPKADVTSRDPWPTYRPPVVTRQATAKVATTVVPTPRSAPAQSNNSPIVPNSRFRPREVLVVLPGEATTDFIADLSNTYDVDPVDSLAVSLPGVWIYRFTVRDTQTVPQAVAAMQADQRLGDVQANYISTLAGSSAGNASMQYALASLSVPDALAHATGRNVSIAVIDTGVDTGHPEIKGVVTASYDAVRDDTPVAGSHGTAIAGIIGAHGTLRGVAPGARILAVRAFATGKDGGTGETDSMTLARAMDWAASRGAAIFNMSFAGPEDPLLLRMLDAAASKGIVLVAAAGNGGPDAEPVWPAAHPEVIAVTAVDHADRLYAKANRGDYVAVAAPGVDILTAETDGSYGVMTGTSMAAAHVSGIIALTLEAGSAKGSQTARELLSSTAHDLGPAGRDDEFGAGKANALDALTAVSELPTTQVASDRGAVR